MVLWKQYIKRIPHIVQLNKVIKFEVVWTDAFVDHRVLGETRFEPNQIVLKTGLSHKETTHTYIHELIHAVSETYDVGLTETQVLKLEKALYFILKPGNIFKEK